MGARLSVAVVPAFALLAASSLGCDGRTGGGADADADGAPDSDAPDAASDAAPEPCTPGERVCHADAVRLCDEEGLPGEVVRDCTALPFERCVVGPCDPVEAIDVACCVAEEPFCHAEVEVEGKAPLAVDYRGLWDDDFACAGSIAVDGYNWSLWARVPSCEGRFVRVVLSGYLDGWEPGATYPLCHTATSVPDLLVRLTADEVTYQNEDPDPACPSVSGSVTFHEYGAAPGEPFRLTIDGVLVDPGSGATRSLRVEAEGALMRYPS